MTTQLDQKQFEQTINTLNTEWCTFEKDELLPTEHKLTSILGKCKTLADDARGDETAKAKMEVLLNAKDIGYNKATSLYSKVVKLVMYNSKTSKAKATLSKYAKVIQIAQDSNITGDRLAGWIEEHGGLEEIAYPKKKNGGGNGGGSDDSDTTVSENVKTSYEYLKGKSPIVTIEAASKETNIRGAVLLIGNVNDDNTTDVLAFLDSTLLDKALEELGKKTSTQEAIQKQTKQSELTRSEDAMKRTVAKAKEEIKRKKAGIAAPVTIPVHNAAGIAGNSSHATEGGADNA